MRVYGKDFSVQIDRKGNIQEILFQKKGFEPPLKYTLYEIDAETADVSEIPDQRALTLWLTTKEASGRLVISSGKEIRFHMEPDKDNAVKKASIVLPFPLGTKFHIPERFNMGRLIDRDMSVGEQYSTGVHFKFFLATFEGFWIRFIAKQRNKIQRLHNARLDISRHPNMFIVTFTWNVTQTDDVLMSVFSSMDEAMRDYETWLEKELGIRKLKDRPNTPEWVHNVRLVLIVDMMRSNWGITHDYNDVINLANDLKRIGCPKDTLLYIPGYNGAYDSAYPNYGPHSELGGEEKFREMIEILHRNEFRVMIHTNSWGLDPYHPEVEKYLKYALKGIDGNYVGFQTGTFRFPESSWESPPSIPLKFRTEKIPFKGPKGAKSFTFETVNIPDTCQAFIAVGHLNVGCARVKFTINRSTNLTPQGWFEEQDEYDLPFAFRLNEGRNKVHLEVIGEDESDVSEGWYQIRYCFIPPNPYSTWTHPILLCRTSHPEWIEIFADEVASVVKKYDIDAVHVDCTEYEWRKDICLRLKEALPNVAMSGEGFATLGGLGFWTFAMNAFAQSLTGHVDVMNGTREQGSLPDRSELEKLYSWLNKPSPVTNFVKDYVRLYPHLCAADAFVPVGKVCNTFPPRQSPRKKEELWKVIRDTRRLNYIPGLRVNYRKYGLDEDTKKAIQEISSWK